MSQRPGYNLEKALRRLHLTTIRRLYAALAEQAEKENWTFREYLEQLISEEMAHRAETRMTRSTCKAKFPFLKTIDEFDFTFQQSVKKKALGRFFGPELVEDGRSVILFGKPGRGKTHLVMTFKAIPNGYDALAIRAEAERVQGHPCSPRREEGRGPTTAVRSLRCVLFPQKNFDVFATTYPSRQSLMSSASQPPGEERDARFSVRSAPCSTST